MLIIFAVLIMTGMINVNEGIKRLSAKCLGVLDLGGNHGQKMAIANGFVKADLTELWEN